MQDRAVTANDLAFDSECLIEEEFLPAPGILKTCSGSIRKAFSLKHARGSQVCMIVNDHRRSSHLVKCAVWNQFWLRYVAIDHFCVKEDGLFFKKMIPQNTSRSNCVNCHAQLTNNFWPACSACNHGSYQSFATTIDGGATERNFCGKWKLATFVGAEIQIFKDRQT